MKNNIDIKLLAQCPQQLKTLAELWYSELGQHWIPNASVERAEKTFQSHLNIDNLPLTFVALNENRAVGMCSLRENDGIREDLTPWLGSLIVAPSHRRQKIGEQLIDRIKQAAKQKGHALLYLFALDASIPTWYETLGWKKIGMDKLYHHPVTVMQIEL
jgi:predicted N-acetyltransferase YhbS